MSNESNTIHEFDYSLICEYFSSIKRQGPGSPDVTKMALGFIENLTEESKIADIGCGTGGQTIVLAQNVPGTITAIDLFPDFIKKLNQNAIENHLQSRITGIVTSMENLPFREDELDLIWSEGAIYNIGFERGFNEWRKFLKKGGYLAATEATWFTETRPDEIHQFWNEAYSEIDTVAKKVAQMQKAGYLPVATFMLPEICWTEHFFKPQIAAQEVFQKKYAGNKVAEDFVAYLKHEAVLYEKYKEYYGYIFYIGKKL